MSEMPEDERIITALVDGIDAYLATSPGPGVATVRAGIAQWRLGSFRTIPPRDDRSLCHLDRAADDMARRGRADLARAIVDAAPLLHWAPYDSYPRDTIGADFADNHTFASVAVHRLSEASADFDFGLFIVGPNLLYRDHDHAAPELYVPLTGPHGFRFASGEQLNWLHADAPVWNEPFRQHAIKTGSIPFLCIYAWTADVMQPARIIFEADWAELEASQPPSAD
jgi:hypothetical protein